MRGNKDTTADVSRWQKLLASDSEGLRQEAVTRLSGVAGQEAAEALITALGDPEWRVRKSAADALRERVGPPVVQALIDMIRRHPLDENILNTAIQVLVSAGANVVGPVASLLTENDPKIRMHAAQTLGLLREPAGAAALRRTLDDPNENVRFHVVEALGSLGDLASVPLLLERLDRESPYLRFTIIEALGAIGDGRAVPALLNLIDDGFLREAVISALGCFSDERPVPPLVSLMAGEDEEVAREAASALVSLQENFERVYGESRNIAELVRQVGTPDLVSRVLRRLRTAQEPVWLTMAAWLHSSETAPILLRLLHSLGQRRRVTELLPILGPEVIDLVARELRDVEAEVRRAACLVLGRLGTRQATEALVQRLDDESVDVRIAAAGALARLGDPTSLEPLVAHLGEEDARVRQTLVEAVNSIGSPVTLPSVLPLLDSSAPQTREAAIQILGYFGFPEALEPVLARLEDPDLRVRVGAIAVLPYFESPNVVPVLLSALGDSAPRMRAEAARALGRLPSPAVEAALRARLTDPDSWVRYRVCLVLSELPGVSDAEVFVPLLEDRAPQVRIAACMALERIGGKRALAALMSSAEDADPEVRRAALAALGKTRDPAALGTLIRALESREMSTRAVVARALGEFKGRQAIGQMVELARRDPAMEVKREVLKGLAAMGNRTAWRELLRLCNDPRLREDALAALSDIRPEQVPMLAKFARAADSAVALASVTALGRVRHPEATSALAEIVDDPKATRACRDVSWEALRMRGRMDLLPRAS